MKVLSLSCQKDYQSSLGPFLRSVLTNGVYDFLLLQEATEPVLAHVRNVSSYQVLTATDAVIGKQSLLSIVYRKNIPLVAHTVQSFAGMRFDPVAGYKHLGFGVLGAIFEYEGGKRCFGSIHLHAGIDPAVRARELPYVKDRILDLGAELPVIVGGDFNFGYPWELSRASRILGPELICETSLLGGTLDSRYSELVDHLPNKIAHALARIGVGIKLKTDHFFANHAATEFKSVLCRVLPDRVSDHSPIELVTQN